MLCRTISAFVVATAVTAIASGATVDGSCYLEGQTCSCLTMVEMDGSALHLPQYTDCAGHYGPFTLVAPGWHTLTFTHAEYQPATLVIWVPALGLTASPVTLPTKAVCDPNTWKDYPYALPGSSITIPHDEGRHDPTATYRVEWWYVNFHLTDEDGRRYAGVVSFFKPPIIGSPCMVLFSVIDLEDGTFRSGARYPLVFSASEEWFELDFGLPPTRDQWFNRQCEGHLVPFEYHLSMDWVSNGIAWLELDMGCLKPPLPVSGDGFVEFGSEAWTYYYSHPRVDIAGQMYLPGFPALGKDVQGYGWIDHQWASLPTGLITWEWLSIQFDDLREIMVGDVWISGEQQGSFSGGLNYYDENCTLDVLSNYTMTPVRCWYDAEHNVTYTTQWKVEQPTRQIDLLVTADYEHQVVETTGQILGANFWEGACTVSGTIGGQPVSGTAFAELTHGWPPPPPPLQACCMDDGTCRYLPPDLCAAQGGTPAGAGTTCATTVCPQACCLPNGTCTLLLPTACAAQGGQSLGPGVTCDPPEACCLAGQGCVMLSPACCLEQRGVPWGPGTDCTNPDLCDLACCPTSPFGNGSTDHTVSPGTTAILVGDADYHNLTVEAGGTVVTNGHTLRVCGTLLNMGTIKGGFSGTWGAGGAGGRGANPKGAPNDPTGCGRTSSTCTSGGTGLAGTGRGGDGGCGGGGGGGATSDDAVCTFDADGGNGGAGGQGGRGSADVLVYAFRFDNQGVVQADAENGENGHDAPAGDQGNPDSGHYESCGAEYYHCPLASRDLAGGGGGGGQGGDGGDAGNINIYYGIKVTEGTLHASRGEGGSGGQGGTSGGCLQHGANTGGYQSGCTGCEGHGAGGRGAHTAGDCAADGQPGGDGAPGTPGPWQLHAVTYPDCNSNGFPDQCDIYHGFSQDSNSNGIPDECEAGACCQADCACSVTPQLVCSGTWLGAGTVCSPNPCKQAPSGATANPNPVCQGDQVTLCANGGCGGTYKWYAGGCGSGTSVGSGQCITIPAPLSTTTYYVRVEGPQGNTSCASVTVTVNPRPAIPTNPRATPQTICVGQCSTLDANVPVGVTVDWYTDGCDGGLVPGGAHPSVCPTASTTYYAQARNIATGCVSLNCATVTVTVNVCGACCLPNGTCLVMTEAACDAAGGRWYGAGVACRTGGKCPQWCKGDMNCDGRVTFADIDPFVAALSGESAWTRWPCPWINADCNSSGTVTFADIDPFVAVIGTTCLPWP